MIQIFVKIRLRENTNKYRKLLSTDKTVYSISTEMVQNSSIYHPQTLLDEGEWYSIREFSQKKFASGVLLEPFDSVDFNVFTVRDINKIEYLFIEEHNELYFQSISKSRLIRKKAILHIGEDFKYDESAITIVLNEIPDAIYVRETDTLYFRKLASISGIFKGIDQLYREATEEETKMFLQKDFIVLKNDFSYKDVKIANRKRIALATDTLSHLQKSDQDQVFSYILEYCPNLKNTNDSFEIGKEEDLKMLLYGIEQRFYTTKVGNEKRLANSIIALK